MNKSVEAVLTEGGMVPGNLDNRFNFTLGTVHRGLSPGDDRPDFDLILVVEHFIFGH
jgi:hypothetical protein